ncbi:MAG: hypothetical protein ACI8PT_003302 [Gammaproteobacteria bacterium]
MRALTNDVRASGPGLNGPRDRSSSKRLPLLHRSPAQRGNTLSAAGRALEATSRYIGFGAKRARRRHQLRRVPSKWKYYAGGRDIVGNCLGLRMDATNPLTSGFFSHASLCFLVCSVSSMACGSAERHARTWRVDERAGARWWVVLKSYGVKNRRIDLHAGRPGVHPRCSLHSQSGATCTGRSLPIPCAQT